MKKIEKKKIIEKKKAGEKKVKAAIGIICAIVVIVAGFLIYTADGDNKDEIFEQAELLDWGDDVSVTFSNIYIGEHPDGWYSAFAKMRYDGEPWKNGTYKVWFNLETKEIRIGVKQIEI